MYNANEQELEVLKQWDKTDAFKKSVESRPEDKPYHFYDGPPFATGLPHYGHIVASLIKDVVPRYQTMKGYRVERVWGWDCHGLPIENIIEKELNLNSKKDIEEYGIPKFNEACRSTVLKYAEEWKKTIKRMGRWVDMPAQGGSASGGEAESYGSHGYRTMDIQYMESVWWVFKQLWDKGLIYEGKKAMHICPRCVTPLSNFEVTQGYKDVKDLSATAKFKLKNAKEKLGLDGDVFVLAWTTTPWTLPGNVLLAVGGEIDYVVVSSDNNNFVVAKKRVKDVMKDKEYEVVKELKGEEFVGLEYEPLFPYFVDTENAFRVVSADFVTTEDGTGVVHIAPAFGEDDYQIGKREEVGFVQHVNMDGTFIEEVVDFAGQEVKPKEDPMVTDIEIIKYLAHNDKLFHKEKFEHSYPHCWRCDTPLLNYSTSSWFVEVTKLKEDLLKNNKKTNWVPEHIKEGRFGLWLEGARDWAISRTRFWGTPLPVWRSEDGDTLCIGSAEELSELSGEKVDDLHKHKIDDIVIKKDDKEYRRIPEVLDCWFESGAMPYGQMHYPFENKEKFEAGFPAEFIAEGQDQTRGWFYTLHVLATALTNGKNPVIKKKKTVPAFNNVIVNGTVLAEDGKKMSKRLQNYPDPLVVLEKYGADAMRFYLVSSPVMHAESLSFSEAGVREMYNKVVNTLWNVFTFYNMFNIDSTDSKNDSTDSPNILDKWVLSKLNLLVEETTKNMNEYKLAEASRPILEFVTELSQWYVRRSRDRFKGEDEEDKQFALATLKEVLFTLSKIMAPFTPFMAEKIYGEVGGEMESVHLEDWPKTGEVNHTILENMVKARKLVEMGLALRAESGVKVRQVLGQFLIVDKSISEDLASIIAKEMNVKTVELVDSVPNDESFVVKEDGGFTVGLDITLTDKLKKEGLLREVVRTINQMRKEQKLTIDDEVVVEYSTDDETLNAVFTDFEGELKRSVLATELKDGGKEDKEIDGKKIKLSVSK